MQNKAWQYALTVVLFAAGVFFVKLHFRPSDQPVKLAAHAKLRDYVSHELPPRQTGAIEKFMRQQNQGSTEPADCQVQRDRLIGTEFERLIEDVQNRRLTFNPACQSYDAKLASPSFADMIYKNCKSPDVDQPAKKSACATALFFYKSVLVANATKDEPVNRMDVQTVTHHLFAMLGMGEMKTPESISKIEELTNRLKEELPNSPGAYKAALIPTVIREMTNSTPETTEKLQQALNEARALNPNDPQVEDIDLFLQTRDGRNISVEKAEAVVAQNPDSSAAQLFLAKAYARHQDYGHAQTMLTDLARQYPNDARIQEAYAEMRTKDYDKLGQFQISLNGDDL